MRTTKQIAANKANAQHSTGPQSQAAKAAVHHNATRHGLTSKQLIVPGEDPAAFELLEAGLILSYNPANLHEQILITQIAENLWRLLRVRGIETTTPAPVIPGECRLRTPANGTEAAAHTFDNLRRYEAAIERAYYRTIDHLVKLQKERRATVTTQKENLEIGCVSQKSTEPKIFTSTEAATIAPSPAPDPKPQPALPHLVPSH